MKLTDTIAGQLTGPNGNLGTDTAVLSWDPDDPIPVVVRLKIDQPRAWAFTRYDLTAGPNGTTVGWGGPFTSVATEGARLRLGLPVRHGERWLPYSFLVPARVLEIFLNETYLHRPLEDDGAWLDMWGDSLVSHLAARWEREHGSPGC